MQILSEADRDALVSQYAGHEQRGFIAIALSKRHCFIAEISMADFEGLVLNSSPTMPHPRPHFQAFPTLRTAVEEIIQDERFLDTSRLDGGLSGSRVKYYRDQFRANESKPEQCFIVDRTDIPELIQNGEPYYIIDGMHRLVGYALATGIAVGAFPLRVYYCTNS